MVSSYFAQFLINMMNCIEYCNLNKIQDAITSLSGPSHKLFMPHQRVFERDLYYFYFLTTAIMLWENYRNDGTLFLFSLLTTQAKYFEEKSEQKQILQVTIATFFATAPYLLLKCQSQCNYTTPHPLLNIHSEH